MKGLTRHDRARAILLALSLLSQTAFVNAQQQQQPTAPPSDEEEVVRLNTELVQLRAVVTDRKGQPVEDLKKEDFEVFENGQPREVNFFSVERVPASPGAAPTPGETRTTPGARTPDRVPPARTVVLFVDTLHLTRKSLARAKVQLRRFVDEQMTDRDLVAVVATYGTLGVLQQFTRDRGVLRYAIEKLSPFHGIHTAITPYLASRVVNNDPEAINEVVSILAAEEGYVSLSQQAAQAYAESKSRAVLAESSNLRRATLRTLGAVSERLAAMRGQRLIAFVSDGFSLYDDGGSTDRDELAQAESRAARAGVLVYAIYPKGLVAPNDLTSGPVIGEVEGGKYMTESIGDVQASLRELAYSTGGDAYLNTNDLRAPMQKMLDSNRVYYSLAYYLPKDSDKKFREIKVRVRNHPEYSVRTQRGYTPPTARDVAEVASTPRQKLFQAMMSPLPATDIGVTSQADFLEQEADAAQVTLQIHFDGDALKYERRGQDYLLDCELSVAVLDKTGKIATSFAEALKGVLAPAQYEEARRSGYRYSKRLSLKPGLYQLRVGVREVGSELLGTSSSWVEVPDLSAGRPALSSLFLGKLENADVHVRAAGTAEASQPRLILGRATFKGGEVAFYRFVVYNTQSLARPEGAAMKVEIVQGEAPVYEGAWQPLSTRAIRSDRKGTEAGGQIRLALKPGVYTLRVTVRDAGSKKSVQQSADFEVESER